MGTTIAQTLAGSTISISAALPATFDYAGFSALSYTVVGEITDLGTGLGKKYTLVQHAPVGDRKIFKFRGNYNNGTLALKFARATAITTNAGQTLLNAAAASDNDYSFLITLQDTSKIYFTAKTMEALIDMGTVNNLLMGAASLEVNSDIVEHA